MFPNGSFSVDVNPFLFVKQLNCLLNFRKTIFVLKKKSTDRPRTAAGPENVVTIRASIEQSPKCYARKYAAVLQLSDRYLWRVLHHYFKTHPYKNVITQGL